MSNRLDTRENGRAGWSYCGEAWTDGQGRAIVSLPPATRRSHANFAYELTPADPEVAVELVDELCDGAFALTTDRPYAKVAWRLTELGDPADPASPKPGGAP